MKLKLGSTVEFVDVLRADGRRERICGKLHNIVSNGILTDTRMLEFYASATRTLRTHSTRIRRTLDGTFSQSGTTVTRVTGTEGSTNNQILVWENGDWAYTTSTGTSTRTVSRAFEKSTQALQVITSALSNGTDAVQSKSVTASGSYSAGTILTTIPETAFDPASSPYTCRRISFDSPFTVTSSVYALCFDLPVDIELDTGDAILVGGIEFRREWDTIAVRELAVCPLAGLTTSCRAARMKPAHGSFATDGHSPPTRIWLIDDGDEYALPSTMPVADVNPSVLTVLETITASGSNTGATASNHMTSSNSCFGTVATGGSTIKQIAWGTTGVIHGILEFDTPQNIAAGKIITIGGRLQFEIEVPAP